MLNDYSLNELKRAYENYKKGNYTFGKYGTGEQIQNAFMDGKIFVLKRTNKVWGLLLVMFSPFLVLFAGLGRDYFMIIFTISGVFFIILSVIILISILLMRRTFLVISSSGFYYRKFFSPHYFQWSAVSIADARIKTTRGGYRNPPVTFAQVKVNLPDGKKIKFISNHYSSKEFVKKVKRLMFLRLFQIYSGL